MREKDTDPASKEKRTAIKIAALIITFLFAKGYGTYERG
jgi:hypothetical protein